MLLACLPATHLVSWCLEARVDISKNRAKEEKRLRIEGIHSVTCREKGTTQLHEEQMGKGAGPTRASSPLDFTEGLGSLCLLLCVSGCSPC